MDIDGMFAAHYSRVISEKVRASNAKARAEGICLYPAPIGYLDRGSGNKPLDPKRAPLVKRLFELYATGEWSISQLVKWAQEQGLTSKPARERRTPEEVLAGQENTNTKAARPASRATINRVLRNPFYIGKLMYEDAVFDGKHQPLIDVALFDKVQAELARNYLSVHYVDKEFYRYRGMIRCSCRRLYTPYKKKGFTYYTVRCPGECSNPTTNLREESIDGAVESVLDRLQVSEAECFSIGEKLNQQMKQIGHEQEATVNDLRRRQRRLQEDMDYLKGHKVHLLRTEAYEPEEYQQDLERLKKDLDTVKQELASPRAFEGDLHKHLITICELLKNARLWYKMALDVEKHEIVKMVFCELVVHNQNVAEFTAKKGFSALQKCRSVSSGGPELRKCELVSILSELKELHESLRGESLYKRIMATCGA